MAVALATLPRNRRLAGAGDTLLTAGAVAGVALVAAFATTLAGLAAALGATTLDLGAGLVAGLLEAAAFLATGLSAAFFTGELLPLLAFEVDFADLATVTGRAGAFLGAACFEVFLAATLTTEPARLGADLAAVFPATGFLTAGFLVAGFLTAAGLATTRFTALLAGFAAAFFAGALALFTDRPPVAVAFDLPVLTSRALARVFPFCALAAVELPVVFAISLHR